LLDDADWEGFNRFGGPAAVTLHPSKYTSFFEDYFERFGPQMRWQAVWDWFHIGGSERQDWYPLFVNSSARCVGFVRERFLNKKALPRQEPALSVVLPNVADPKVRQEATLYLLQRVLPQLRPAYFPNHWYHSYVPPGLAKQRAALDERQGQVLAEIEAERKRVEAAASAFEEYKPLVRLGGDDYKDLLAKALHGVLGFRVTDLDQGLKKNEAKGADLLAEDDDWRMLVEARGVNRRSAKLDDIERLHTHATNFAAKRGEPNARVLIINAQSDLPPEKRAKFSPDVLDEAAKRRITLVSAPTFLGLIETWRAGRLSRDELKAFFGTPGCPTPPAS
jgi:hypothetical protein